VFAQGRVLSREQILNQARPDNYEITDRAVDVQVLRIRKKIGDTSDSGIIQTVRGIGYMLSA
jgi:DNA-binding response OmpR family regulator